MKRGTRGKDRFNLYLPEDLLEDIRRLIPGKERTRFVTEVLAREIRRLKLKSAIEASAGAWRNEDHPELATSGDIDSWIEEGRATLGWN